MLLKSKYALQGQWLFFLCKGHEQPDKQNKVAHVTAHKCSVPGCENTAYSLWYKTQELNIPDSNDAKLKWDGLYG
jgi:hypothetical protein